MLQNRFRKFRFRTDYHQTLFSISSALNATLFGGSNIAYSLAKDGELPALFDRKIWFKSTEGLYLTAGLGLAFALFFNLEAIASITSAVMTVIYIAVLLSHLNLAKQYGGHKWLIILNLLVLFLYLFPCSIINGMRKEVHFMPA